MANYDLLRNWSRPVHFGAKLGGMMNEIPRVMRVEEGRGGLRRVTVASDLATAELYLHGAHLAQFQQRGQKPLLFLSGKSHFDAAKPIRGGVPVIYPWFGPKAGSPEAPMHGYARLREWTLETATEEPDGTVRVALSLVVDAATVRMTFGIGGQLEMEMAVQAGPAPLAFEQALHTYFAVGDVRQCEVKGLEGVEYIDKTDGFKRKREAALPVRITAETDRVYLGTTSTCVIQDASWGRSIEIAKEGSKTTVVWNPWIAKAAAMADFGADEWPGMLCVETANAGEAAVRLEAGQKHRMNVRIKS